MGRPGLSNHRHALSACLFLLDYPESTAQRIQATGSSSDNAVGSSHLLAYTQGSVTEHCARSDRGTLPGSNKGACPKVHR